MRDIGRGDDRWFQRMWQFVDVDAARPFNFPEPGPQMTPYERLEQILRRLKELELTYAHEPTLFGHGGQKVRTPRYLGPGAALTCLDVVALTAAACVLGGLGSWMVGTIKPLEAHVRIVVQVDGTAKWKTDSDLRFSREMFLAWEARRLGGGEIEHPDELAELVASEGFVLLDPTSLVPGYPKSAAGNEWADWESVERWAKEIVVCDVGYWWEPRWIHRDDPSPVEAQWLQSLPTTEVEEQALEPRPRLDQECDEWLESGGAGLLLVGHGGQGATSALRRLVSRAAPEATVLMVAAAPWNATRWRDHDGDAVRTVSEHSLGQRLLQGLAVQWERDGPDSSPTTAQAVYAALLQTGDPWASGETVLRRLQPGRDLLVVFDGLESGWTEHERKGILRKIALLHGFGREYPDLIQRRLRTVVASERDPRLVDALTEFDTIDLDEVARDPGEIAARRQMLAQAHELSPEESANEMTWAEISLRLSDPDGNARSTSERMANRLRRLRHDRARADRLLGVLLAARGPLPRWSLDGLATLGPSEDELMALVQPWLRGAGDEKEVELHSAARQWLQANDSMAALVQAGNVALARAALAAEEGGARDLSRYADRHLVAHVLMAEGTPEFADLSEQLWERLNDPSWQARLVYRDGPAMANADFRAWTAELASRHSKPSIWHNVVAYARRPLAGVRLPVLARQRRGAVFQAAGGERPSDLIEVEELGLRIEREERVSGVRVDLRVPEAWRGAFILLTVVVEEGEDGIEVLVPLTDADAPRAWVELQGQTLASHDVEVGMPLSVDQVAMLDPDLLDRSRRLPQSSRAAKRWDLVDELRRP